MKLSIEYDQSIYNQFLAIDDGAYRDILHFYESYRHNFIFLDIRQQFIIQVCYIEALFEMNKYKEMLMHIDDVIESAIENNLSVINDIDVYYNLLYKKSVALNLTGHFDEALSITRQLLSLDPDEPTIRHFFKSLILKQSRKLVLPIRVFFITGILTTACIMFLEILLIKPFYESYIQVITNIRNLVFLFSVVVFISGEATRYLLMEYQSLIHFKLFRKQQNFKIQQQERKITIK